MLELKPNTRSKFATILSDPGRLIIICHSHTLTFETGLCPIKAVDLSKVCCR